jgi:Kef-type K+ transport system membrane component KefB
MALATGPVAPIGAHQLLVFLLQVGLLLALALLLGRLAVRFRMPAIVGELCAGVAVGPSVLAHAAPALSRWLLPGTSAQYHLLDAVGEIGVLLLVGITGAQLDLGLVRRRGITAARVGAGGLIVPLGLGIATGLLLPASLVPASLVRGSAHRVTFALFLGVAMGVSAIPVIAKTLLDMRLLHRDVGQLILCSVMVDDIAGWMLLSVVALIATVGLKMADIGISLGYLAITAAVAVIARPLVRMSLRAAGRAPDSGPTIAVVTILILLSAVATQAMGLEAIFGAFVCGLVIRSSGALEETRLAPLRSVVLWVFAPLYFATAGLRMNLTALTRLPVLLAGLVIVAVAIAGKFAGAYAGAKLSRLSHWEALALGAGINSRGVVEIIIAMVGLQLHVLSSGMYTIIVLVAIVTSLMAPPVLRLAMARVEHTAEEELRADLYEVADPASIAR